MSAFCHRKFARFGPLLFSIILALAAGSVPAGAAGTAGADADLDGRFTNSIHPFLQSYCFDCHSGQKAKGDLDLTAYPTIDSVVHNYSEWSLLLDKLTADEMPPEKAKSHPTPESRQAVVDWIKSALANEARKHAGDPGIVLARRLSNAEYNYTIRDLTGVDIQPTREFPVDPANQAGFDNSGESLDMSPALMNKYLLAAREVANHMVLQIDGIDFAPYPMLVETDRDKYCINRIVDFYHQQDTNYADYFLTAWRYEHRKALGKPHAKLADFAAESHVSPKYLAVIWSVLQEWSEKVGPIAKLQSMWHALPVPKGNQPDLARDGCVKMCDFVTGLRAKLEVRFPNISVTGISGTSQPFLMWKNRQYATHRMDFDHDALQIEGEMKPEPKVQQVAEMPVDDVHPLDRDPMDSARNRRAGDPDLRVPRGRRAQYEAAFARFCAVFPDAFYVSERGRNYLDNTKDKGRLLSAGFHNLMGYFRDDLPLYQLILDEKGQKELDKRWQELDFIASANVRTYVQFYLNESGEARGGRREQQPDPGFAHAEANDITSPAMIMRVADTYLARAKASSNAVAIQAIEDHFKSVNDGIRWVEKARVDTESRHLSALQEFAARAYRRPLTQAERNDLVAFYHSCDQTGLDHEEAMRDSLASILMSPDFCYRIDLVEGGPGIHPLSDNALASRLSYFLWASMPDKELLDHAAAGDLHRPEVLRAQTRRMLKDDRAQALATEFGGNWLDFRRFEELSTVDRERFPGFNNDLREAMFQEPIRYFQDVAQNNRSILDFLYGKDTFVNPALAAHYGITGLKFQGNEWVHVEDATAYGRGGLLPMSAFLTKNAPGLRTSPVKRGYWVVRRVLGEVIPPPPATVPELPHDEAKMDLPLRDMLARHREDPSCAVCHSRFDSFGLVFEGYGPVGEARTNDLAGRPVDCRATFPDGTEEAGVAGLRDYIRAHREKDFVDNLCRKMLVYALGRGLILSDEATIADLHAKLAANGYRFDTLIENIVTSPQFLNKRGHDVLAQKDP